MTSVDFTVDRADLRKCGFEGGSGDRALAPGEVRVRVDRFAFTANNVSYAVAGDMLKYWDFFPAPAGRGRIPVWGFGDVVESKCPGVEPGERLFGYFPMSDLVVMRPGGASERGFADASPHRSHLPPVYNQYTRVASDPAYDPEREDEQMVLWPLFMTSFLLDDFLDDEGFFGARAVVISSASSKTAFGLAFLLSRREAVDVIGLTSARNLPFVEGLGCYGRALAYERITELPADLRVVFVDVAGDGRVVRAVHEHFRGALKHSCAVGATHWEHGKRERELPGPAPQFFFAPTRIQKRSADWGPGGLQRRFAGAWREFLAFTGPRLRIVRSHGEQAVRRVYLEVLEGRARPDESHVLSLHEEAR